MKEADRARITRALQDIDTWRASGLKLKAYAQSRGEELSHWRARLSWEQRWRQALAGAPGVAFVRAVPVRQAKASKTLRAASISMDPAKDKDTCVRIVLGREGSALRASVDWPLYALGASGAWLREVLA